MEFLLLRDALRRLGLEPDDQRRELSGTVMTDELALDLDGAVASLEYAQEADGMRLPEELVAELRQLNELLSAPAGDEIWDERSLDHHKTWAEARRWARNLLRKVPSE